MLGRPYEKGARGPDTFDCWGAVVEAARRMGASLPVWSTADWDAPGQYARFEAERAKHVWSPIKEHGLQQGDVGIARRETGACHACIYVGGGMVLHSERRAGVVIEQITSFKAIYKRVTWARHG